MLTVLFNWCYILFTAFCLGYGFACLIGKRISCYFRMDSILAAGLILATVYAQFFSLIYKVGLLANLILLMVCGSILFLTQKQLAEDFKSFRNHCGAGRMLVILALFLVWGYFTSRGYMAYDSDLYHAQSIRWIEEYGIVKGLGNLHERFAYNSSVFALSALYSMKFLLGKSLHTVSGFFALLLSLTVLDLGHSWKRKKLLLSDFARIAAIYYLMTICDEVVAPSSDYAIMCMIFFIVIKWLDLLERQEKSVSPYALLCVAGVYALTLKLTAGLILILVIKPACMLLKEKRWKEILLYLSMGILVAAPWMARTVLISGWLFYPFPELDLFTVDWKMKAENVRVDAAQIKAWARGLYSAERVGEPVAAWFPVWFRSELCFTEKLLILADMACCLFIAVAAVWTFLKKKWNNLDILLVLVTVLCSYLFWQFSAPMMRYGYAYVLLTAALTGGFIVTALIRKDRLLYFALLLYGVYKIFMISVYIYGSCRTENYIWQADYGTYALKTYEIDGVTFYYPIEGDRTGYASFPSAPTHAAIELRGEGLKSGFRPQ